MFDTLSWSLALGSLLLSLQPESSIVALLLLLPELPLTCDAHVVVLQPKQVLSVSPVTRCHISETVDLSEGLIGVDVPVSFFIDGDLSKPAAANVADLALHVLNLAQVTDLLRILGVEQAS